MDANRRIQLEKISTQVGALIDAWDGLSPDLRGEVLTDSPAFGVAFQSMREILEHEHHFCSYCNETRECADKYCARGVNAVCDRCVPREAV